MLTLRTCPLNICCETLQQDRIVQVIMMPLAAALHVLADFYGIKSGKQFLTSEAVT